MTITLEFPEDQRADIVAAFKSLERKPAIKLPKKDEKETEEAAETDEDFLARRLTLYVNAHTAKFKAK